MAYLPEEPIWDAGIYQIETTDPVLGGPNGVSNKPLKNLANRTLHLKGRVENLESSKAPLASPAFTGIPTAPTAAAGTNTTQVATTSFVKAAGDQIHAAINSKANTAHAHAIADVTGLQTALDGKLPVNGTAVALAGFTNSSSPNPISGADAATQNGLGYVTGISLFGQVDGALHTQAYDATYAAQIFQDYRTGQLAGRGKNNGNWTAWRTMLDSVNFNNYTPTKTGDGASGTWSINITGNAASASAVPWGGVSGRPTDLGSFTNGPGYVTNAPTKSGGGAFGTWGIDINGNAASANTVPWVGVIGRPTDLGSFTNGPGYVTDAPTKTGGGASGTWGINISGRGFPKKSDGGDLNFSYSGQGGQPAWLWGTSDGTNNQVFNPLNFSVAYAARSTRLMRRDSAENYSLQHHWTGTRWRLQGYLEDTFHAQAEVGYADLAGAVADAGSSKNGYGYVKLPGSGLIIQWGRFNIGNPPRDLFGTATFPIAFPNAVFQVNTTLYSFNADAFDATVGVNNHSLTDFNWTVQEWSDVSQSIDITYIAIGY